MLLSYQKEKHGEVARGPQVSCLLEALQDMAKQLEVDAKKDEDIYDKMVNG